MKQFALIGKNVTYSYSKMIHEYLGKIKGIDLEYHLKSVAQISELDLSKYEGVNITTPYKQQILEHCSSKSEIVQKIGNANTLDMNLKAYNTDLSGLKYALEKLVGELTKLKRIVVLGNSSTAKMIQYLFKEQEVIIVSRTPNKNQVAYGKYDEFYGDLIINTTPVTMQNINKSPVKKRHLENFTYAYDLNYNPSHNYFLRQASDLNISNDNGLLMLIMQAVFAFEIWHNTQVSKIEVAQVIKYVKDKVWPKKAIIGMPYSGKTSYGRELENKGYRVIDLDQEISNKIEKPEKYIEKNGIEAFREIEHRILKEVVECDYDYLICGGGIVENIENYSVLSEHQILYLKKDLNTLQVQMEKSQQKNEQKRPVTPDYLALKSCLEKREIKYKVWAKNCIIY